MMGSLTALTEYEQQRLQHIQRNQEFMARLGLPSLIPGLSPDCEESKPKARRRVKAADKERVEGTRRSARVKQEAPLFTGAEIDNLPEEDDVEASGAPRKRIKRQSDATDEQRAATMRAVLEDSRLWLQSSRDALLKVGGPKTPYPLFQRYEVVPLRCSHARNEVVVGLSFEGVGAKQAGGKGGGAGALHVERVERRSHPPLGPQGGSLLALALLERPPTTLLRRHGSPAIQEQGASRGSFQRERESPLCSRYGLLHARTGVTRR